MSINLKNLTPSVYQSSYSSQQQKKQQTSSKAYPVMGANPTVRGGFGSNVTSMKSSNPVTNMQNFLQPVTPKVAQVKPAQNMSVGKPVSVTQSQNQKIQGSGMTANYASNPSNYIAPQAAPKPTPQPTVADWLSKTNDLYDRATKYYDTSEAKRLAQQQQTYNDTIALQNEMYDNARADLQNEIPFLQQNYDRFKTDVQAGMAENRAAGEQQKANARTYVGEAQRTAMQNKRQTDAQREKQYAALGTIDSYGTGSFTQGNENADSEFNRQTAQRYDALSQSLTDIDTQVAQAQRQAQSLIDQKNAEYEQTVRQINSQLRNNETARRGAITQAYNTLQESIGTIQDQYESLRISAEEQKLKFAQEMEKLTAENTMPTLSTEFMQTGVPTTQDDFNFIYKKPEAATALQKMLNPNSAKKPTEKGQLFTLAAQSAQQALDSLDAGIANTGKGQAISSWFGRLTGDMSASQTDYETKLAAARGVALNALAGANVPPAEYERLADMIPVLTDEPQVARQKLASFIQVMGSYGNSMNQAGTALSDDQVASLLTEIQGI